MKERSYSNGMGNADVEVGYGLDYIFKTKFSKLLKFSVISYRIQRTNFH